MKEAALLADCASTPRRFLRPVVPGVSIQLEGRPEPPSSSPAVPAPSGSDEAKWELLLRSLPAFGTLFRHALIALGDAGTGTKREAAALLKERTGIDTSVFGQLVDIRENRAKRNTAKVDEVFARYLKLVEQVTATVDKMLDPAA